MNLLSTERSPYLLQHAGNPVHWMPWGEAAFARARAEDRPIFLSIGYSTCHWCHVMAHESFEDPGVADLLNDHFVAVKVDREERPDVDRVYMTYVQATTGHGGWPLSAWLTPDLKPFYGGTYFPPADMTGRPGFSTVLRAIAQAWREQRPQLVQESERVIGVLREHAAGAGGAGAAPLEEVAPGALALGLRHFEQNFDAANGGFGGAPKFPRAAGLHFLLRATGERREGAARMAALTLRKMAQGGIHDQVGGGFHRYSVDGAWFVPHFEKMLYDQAQIALNCLDARVATGDERFAWLARDILGYVARDLTGPHGAFYSAEDADSLVENVGGRETEHGGRSVEGAFYVWTAAELDAVLGGFAPAFRAHFGVTAEGNVPPALDPHGEFRGKNILAQRQPLAATAEAAGLGLEEANERMVAALATLRATRASRPRPHLDDKVLTAWNALMISALVRGYLVLGEGEHLSAAQRAADFVRRELYDEGRGILFRSHRDGRSAIEGFAEDYAMLVQALLDLYEATFVPRWLRWAESLQRTMDRLFWDEADGGYFNSTAEDPHIVVRLKDSYDGAEPAPASVAAMNLVRLGAVLDHGAQGGYRAKARRTLESFQAHWVTAPQALPQMLAALEPALAAPRHVVFAGDPRAADFRALVAVMHERLRAPRALLHVPAGDDADAAWLRERVPWIVGMKSVAGRAAAYVCEEFACQAPVSEPGALRALVD